MITLIKNKHALTKRIWSVEFIIFLTFLEFCLPFEFLVFDGENLSFLVKFAFWIFLGFLVSSICREFFFWVLEFFDFVLILTEKIRTFG